MIDFFYFFVYIMLKQGYLSKEFIMRSYRIRGRGVSYRVYTISRGGIRFT